MATDVSAKTVLTDPVHLWAFGFGAGLAPLAPGTAGTLVGVVLDWAIRNLGFAARFGVVLVLFLAGVWICGESARRLQEHDHPGIVLDEVVGYMAAMLVAPPGWIWMLCGFFLFRAFDILKPWPIRDLDHRITGGLGIMLDDILAAAYTAIVLGSARLLV